MIRIIVFFLSVLLISAQGLTKDKAESFIRALLTDSGELEDYVDYDELALSSRLGITYPEAKHKFLISIDIGPAVKRKILADELTYTCNVETLEDGYSRLSINIPAAKLSYEYIFRNDKMISRPWYYAKGWETINSKYFVFHVSDKSLTNAYAINCLDRFVDSMLVRLKCTDADIKKLQEEKIHYILCRNEDEIKKVTGYAARGLYYLADDFVISTYNCHYHEVSHLLINYALKHISLYTLPLLQEGFAVAYGGRGGKEPDVILQMGQFLEQSKFLNYTMLLSKSDFFQYDASMTYPVSGLYVKFLVNSAGMDKFVELYRKYSSDAESVNRMKYDDNGIVGLADWECYYSDDISANKIQIEGINESDYNNVIIESDNISVYENGTDYLIKTKGFTGYKSEDVFTGYSSNLYGELFPASQYESEKYIITADENEVSIYNMLNNSLVAKYSRGFSIDSKPVTQQDGYFVFTVNKKVFDEDLKTGGFVEK